VGRRVDFLVLLGELGSSGWTAGARRLEEVLYYVRFSKQYYRRLQQIQKQFEDKGIDLGVEPL
jgi:hypothetical protein